MRFNIYHMRNYNSYCETEDKVEEEIDVKTENIEQKIIKLIKHSWLSDYDWIQLELTEDTLKRLEEINTQGLL